MSHKIRLSRLEKMESGDKLWALIGISKPKDAQHQRLLEIQGRQRFYASGGNKEAYHLPSYHLIRSLMAFMVMSRKASLLKQLQIRQRTQQKTNGTLIGWNKHFGKIEGVCSLNRSGTCSYLEKSFQRSILKISPKIL